MIKKFLIILVVFGMASCADPDLSPILTFENSTPGAYPRLTQLITGEFDLQDLTGSQYSYVIEFVDLEKGALVQSFEIQVSYIDNNPGNGDQAKAAQTWKTFSQSDFTTNAKGFKELAVNIPITDVSSLLGLTADEMKAGDFYQFNSYLTTTSGAVYSGANSTSAVNGSAFQGMFDFSAKVTCPLPETAFTGTYEVTYGAGYDASGGFGTIMGATPGEFTLTTVEGSSTRREFGWSYLPDDFNFDGQTMGFDFVCDKVVLFSDVDTGVGCGGGSITISQDGDGVAVDITDDSSFSIDLIDYKSDGGCGVGAIPVTLIFTKK